jgi:hypothetical protein
MASNDIRSMVCATSGTGYRICNTDYVPFRSGMLQMHIRYLMRNSAVKATSCTRHAKQHICTHLETHSLCAVHGGAVEAQQAQGAPCCSVPVHELTTGCQDSRAS